MVDFAKLDYFNDYATIPDPHPYYEYLRAQGPVTMMATQNVLAVTGFEEGMSVYRNHEVFSSIVTAKGPFPPLPFEPDPVDITEQLEAHRETMPYGKMLVGMDPPEHTRTRRLLTGLLTQQRFRENEEFMDSMADRLIDKFIDDGKIEAIKQYSHPFATLAIADLMGVPEEDHEKILPLLGNLPGRLGGDDDQSANPLEKIGHLFYQHIRDRRENPRDDVMALLANATYADGELPDIETTTSLAALVFGAGQDTTVRLIAAMIKVLAEDPELQEKIRGDRELIPAFVEETLRLHGPSKAVFRLAKRRVRVGDKEMKPGDLVMLSMAAMNRDPRKFEDPNSFRLDRKNGREHVSFGMGIHSCLGAPLARAEAKMSLNKLLDRVHHLRIDEEVHGPAGSRTFDYEPNYTQRSLRSINITFARV